MERLDKFLSTNKIGTRSEVKSLLKKGVVTVNGEIVKDPSFKVDAVCDEIKFNGKLITDKKFIYLIMNKPQDVVSATEDNYDKTVIDLLSDEDKAYNPFPVGRLDKDTVGLLILTNDGELNHRLISPKHHVKKTYFARLRDEANADLILKFKEGITLTDGYKCKEADLEINSEKPTEIKLTITEGKFHQVKRMFEAVNNKVLYLRRISFGNIKIDETMSEGEYRHLTKDEEEILFKASGLR